MSEIDIVLIDPPNNSSGRPQKRSSLPHLGLLSVAAVLERAGYIVKYIDAKALGLDIEQCCAEVVKHRPRYVGITATTPTISRAAKIADKLKEKQDTTIIIGGVHITSTPLKTMQIFKSFDIGVIKEGEVTIVELIKALDDGKNLKEVRGLVYRAGDQILLTEPRDYIEDLNSLPLPAWHLLPDLAMNYQPNYMCTKRLPSNHIITSRGCYGRCIFCDKSVTGNQVRAFSVEYVIRMIEILRHKYGIKDLQINDDTFVSLKERAHKICDEIIRRKIDITWSCDARVTGIDKELMEKMKKAGCWQIAFGIESGSQEILNFIKKGITLDQVEKAVNLAKEAGIKVKGFFILGHPTETKETIRQTVDLIAKLNIDDFGLTFFTPYPGSPFYNLASQYGHYQESWDTMGGYCIDSFIPTGFTREELVSYRKLAHRKFYLQPRVIFSKVINIRSPFDLFKFVKGAISFLNKFLTRYMISAKNDD